MGAHLGRLGLVVILLGCGSADYGERVVTRSDSLGVALVESTAPAGTWRVSVRPLVDFGLEAEDPYIFTRIRDLAVLSDGSLIVVDDSPPHVRKFDDEGRFLAWTGSRGDGPGEFQWPSSVVVLPRDSIGIFDSSNSRLSVFDAALELGATRVLEGAGQSRPQSLVQVSDTVFLIQAGLGLRHLEDPSPGLHRPNRELELMSAGGAFLGSIGTVPWGDVFVSEDGGSGAPMFGRITQIHGGDGELVIGQGDGFELEWRSISGEFEQIARLRTGKVYELTDADFAAEIERQVAAWGTAEGGNPEAMRVGLRDRPRVRMRPPYSRVLRDSEGFVWAAEYVSDPRLVAPKRWFVVAPDGSWEAVVDLPDRFTPYVILSDEIVGVGRNEYDVQTVLVFGLERSS